MLHEYEKSSSHPLPTAYRISCKRDNSLRRSTHSIRCATVDRDDKPAFIKRVEERNKANGVASRLGFRKWKNYGKCARMVSVPVVSPITLFGAWTRHLLSFSFNNEMYVNEGGNEKVWGKTGESRGSHWVGGMLLLRSQVIVGKFYFKNSIITFHNWSSLSGQRNIGLRIN